MNFKPYEIHLVDNALLDRWNGIAIPVLSFLKESTPKTNYKWLNAYLKVTAMFHLKWKGVSTYQKIRTT